MAVARKGWWRCDWCGKSFRVRSAAGIAHYKHCGPKGRR